MAAHSRLETDGYGVPQYSGEPDAFEEYQEQAWDLYHGRDGSDQLQAAAAVHLRAGLTGAAYEAVRKITHEKLKTKDAEGKPAPAGVKILLETLKENIAAEAPVKVGELFMTAFYSPTIWRQPGETMQQYIVRRDQEFKRLEEVLADERTQAIMLLTNEYNLKQIGHALRIQYPNASNKPVLRRDFIGASRGQAQFAQTRLRPKRSAAKEKTERRSLTHAYLREDDEGEDNDEAYYEDFGDGDADACAEFSDLDDAAAIDVLLQDCAYEETPSSRRRWLL